MEEQDLQDYLAALKRKRTPFTLIFASVLVISLSVAYLLPPVYRSSATILIEEQEVPPELVRSTITTYATQRLQMISQRIMSRAALEKIIEKFNLYPEERQKWTVEEVLDMMRKDIALDTISADVIDPRTGNPATATIAFTVSYDGHHPDLVQKVANEITSLYLEENLKSRAQKSAETSDFLKEEARQMGEQVTELEKKLASFKEQHVHSLPEQKQLNIQFMERTERDMMAVGEQIRALEERRFYLEGQLAQIEPGSPIVSSTGERILSPQDRLKVLRTEYLGLASKYSEKHPDVAKMRQEIEALTRETGGTHNTLDQVKRLTQLRTELASLSERYSENHPDVLSVKKKIAALEGEIRKHETVDASAKITREQPENPAYITLQAQHNSVVQDLAALVRTRQELKAKLADYERRLGQSPDVERQYTELVRDYENATIRYRELKAKQMEAEIAQQLEKESKGEKFSLIDPPALPEKPIKPNRPAIAVLGFVLAIAGSAGYVLLMEMLDKTVRGVKGVLAVVGAPPLAMIPYLETEEELAMQKKRRLIAVGSIVAAILVTLLLIHWLVTPLDVLWFRGVRKIGNVSL